MKSMKFLLSIFFLCCSVLLSAQTSRADQLYSEGMELQQKQTISSQKSAIQMFRRAKVAYTNETKKAQCDAQIGICNNNIKRIRESNKKRQEAVDVPEPTTEKSEETPKEEEVSLRLSTTRIDFKYKPRKNETVAVLCNSDDWEIVSYPEWLKVYTAANEFSVIADENTGDDRSGILTVKCKDKEVSLIINQSKIKGFNKLLKAVKDL